MDQVTLKDIVEEWLFEKFPRHRLTQNRYFAELWGIRNPQGVVRVRINTDENTIGIGQGKNLSPQDPDFFNQLEKLLLED